MVTIGVSHCRGIGFNPRDQKNSQAWGQTFKNGCYLASTVQLPNYLFAESYLCRFYSNKKLPTHCTLKNTVKKEIKR